MRDRAVVAAAGAVLGMVGLCCGLPVLLSLGFLGAVAGISLGSWVLIVAGLATVAFGLRHRYQRGTRSPRPARHEQPAGDQHADLRVPPTNGISR